MLHSVCNVFVVYLYALWIDARNEGVLPRKCLMKYVDQCLENTRRCRFAYARGEIYILWALVARCFSYCCCSSVCSLSLSPSMWTHTKSDDFANIAYITISRHTPFRIDAIERARAKVPAISSIRITHIWCRTCVPTAHSMPFPHCDVFFSPHKTPLACIAYYIAAPVNLCY